MDLKTLIDDIHENAIAHGWWETPRPFAENIALIHSEVSEALEEFRNGHGPEETYYPYGDKPEGVPSELADTVIRIMDLCGFYGIDLEAAIREKHAYNKKRPYRHGGKVI